MAERERVVITLDGPQKPRFWERGHIGLPELLGLVASTVLIAPLYHYMPDVPAGRIWFTVVMLFGLVFFRESWHAPWSGRFLLEGCRAVYVAGFFGWIFCGIANWTLSPRSSNLVALGCLVVLPLLCAFLRKKELATFILDTRKNAVGVSCPACGWQPKIGDTWTCKGCSATHDISNAAVNCPGCDVPFGASACAECGVDSPQDEWYRTSA